MAVAGSLDIIVRAITTNVNRQIRDGFRDMDSIGAKAGKDLSRGFQGGFKNIGSDTGIGKLRASIATLTPGADGASKAFHKLMRAGFVLQSGLGALAGSLGAVVGAIGALGGAALGAAPSIVVLGGAFGSLLVGLQVAKAAFKGIGTALGKLTTGGGGGASGADTKKAIDDAQKALALVIEGNAKKIVEANNRIRQAQLDLNAAFRAGKEEIQQLGFSAESAALGEKKAALELEKARETLARSQDLPPNSRARKEAELAYQEADLAYRQAKDQNSDLTKEQTRLSKTGVEGTSAVIQARQELAASEKSLSEVTVQAIRDQEDAQIRLNEAMRPAGGAGGGGEDPFKGLTESQKRFTLYLYNTVLPLLRTLKAAAADSFLPVLEEQMNRMISGGLFDRLAVGITSVSIGLGVATKNFTDALMATDNMENLSQFFEDTAKLLPQFGTIFGSAFSSILSILTAAAPVTERFISSIERGTSSLAEMLNVKNKSGELTVFFQKSADLAARLGGIFNNVFGGIGDIIAANVGPGSGGDLLLTWLDKATEGFASFDPAYLESFYKGTASNFIALSDAFGGFFSTIVNAGANPAVGEFFDILNLGAGTFRSVVNDSIKTIPYLAEVASSIGGIIAVFADSASIIGFLEALNFLLNGVEGLAKGFKPLLDVIGYGLGVVQAGAAAFIGLGIAVKIIQGTIRTILLPFQLFTGLIIAKSASTKALTAATTQLAAAELQLQLVQNRAAVGKALNAVLDAKAIGSRQATVLATAELAVANTALAVTEGQVAVAAQAAGVSMAAAFLPITIIIAALALAAAGIFVVIALNQAAMDKAVGATTGAFEDGASAVDVYSQSLLAIGDGRAKTFLSDTSGQFKNMHTTMKALGGAQKDFLGYMKNQSLETDGLAAALEATGKSLSNIAAKNLPAAQAGFKSFTEGVGMSNAEQLIALDEMGDYTKALQDQASQLGINLMGIDGQIDKEKQRKFALGEGEVAIRSQITALLGVATATREAAMATVSASDAYRAATTNAEGAAQAFDLTAFMGSMNAQITTAATQIENLGKLQADGLSEQSIALINGMGAQGAEVAASLATSDAATLERFNATSAALTAKTTQEMILGSAGFSSALAGLADQMGPAGDTAAAALLDGIKTGTISAEEAVSALGLRIPGMIPGVDFEVDTEKANTAVEKILGKNDITGLGAVKKAAEAGTKVNVNTSEATGKIDNLQGAINRMQGKTVPITLDIREGRANGGLITLKQKDGGFISPLKFASGGMFSGSGGVRGAGGPRDDKVPAMLSAGEYVVNALSTKKYLPLLKSINSGSPTFAQPQSMSGGGTNINITVNPSAGMDERALATLVSTELAFQMRKGGTY